MADHKSLFIVDASVLLKWGIDEIEDLEQALNLREDYIRRKIDIIVPPYCFSEVCNMLGRIRKDAISFLSYLITSDILQYSLTVDLANIAFQLMKNYKGISFYDTAYHALAIQEKGTFLTADEKYYKKTKREGNIMLLKDYGKKR